MIEKNRHKTNKLVKQTLKQISRITKIPYAKVIEDFKNGSEYLAYEFWKILEPQNLGYNRVTFCHTCKKFMLYTEEEQPDDSVPFMGGLN